MNALDLFSGIGGISIALSEYCKTIAYCELDPYCQGVLLSRMASGDLNNAPIWDDVKTLDGKQFKGRCDIIFGGFPCQDISVAGRGKGLEGERSGLFFQIMRLAKEIQPNFLFLENVPAITSRGGLRVVREITEMGYGCRWCVISAASVGALHRRERWFLLAHSSSLRLQQGACEGVQSQGETVQYEKFSNNGCEEYVANSYSKSEQGLPSRKTPSRPSVRIGSEYVTIDEWQAFVSNVCRTIDGLPFRVDRLRALGNAVVPQQAKEAFEILMGLKK